MPPATDAPPIVEESTAIPGPRSIPFRTLGRNPYLHHRDYDSAPVAPPEAEGLGQFLVRTPFAQYTRRPQLGWNAAVEGVEQLDDAGPGLQVVPN